MFQFMICLIAFIVIGTFAVAIFGDDEDEWDVESHEFYSACHCVECEARLLQRIASGELSPCGCDDECECDYYGDDNEGEKLAA